VAAAAAAGPLRGPGARAAGAGAGGAVGRPELPQGLAPRRPPRQRHRPGALLLPFFRGRCRTTGDPQRRPKRIDGFPVYIARRSAARAVRASGKPHMSPLPVRCPPPIPPCCASPSPSPQESVPWKPPRGRKSCDHCGGSASPTPPPSSSTSSARPTAGPPADPPPPPPSTSPSTPTPQGSRWGGGGGFRLLADPPESVNLVYSTNRSLAFSDI